MKHPLDENLDPTFEDLYEKLYLFDPDDPDGEGYFIKITKLCFPSVLSEVDSFQVLIRVMAWAVARSYQQPIILKYIYDPDLVLDVLLPRLADTLDFKLPISYPVEDVRMIIKYLQKIRRTRGTFNAIKKLVRILNISRREILEMDFDAYQSVDVLEGDPGVLFVQYNNIYDLDFVDHMLQYVMPAGYQYRIETGADFPGNTHNVIRDRLDFSHYSEFSTIGEENSFYERVACGYKIAISKNDYIRGDANDLYVG